MVPPGPLRFEPFLGRTELRIGLYGVVFRGEVAWDVQKFGAPQKSMIFAGFQKTSRRLMIFHQF